MTKCQKIGGKYRKMRNKYFNMVKGSRAERNERIQNLEMLLGESGTIRSFLYFDCRMCMVNALKIDIRQF